MLSLQCQEPAVLTRNEAENALKVLNSDMVNLMDGSKNDPGIKTAFILYKRSVLPFPFLQNFLGRKPADQASDHKNKRKASFLDACRGDSFGKTDETSHEYLYPKDGELEVDSRLVVTAYKEIELESRPAFPIEFGCLLYLEEQLHMAVNHNARISDSLPEHICTTIEGTNYSCHFKLDRSRKEDTGDLEISVDLAVSGASILQLRINAGLAYHDPGYSFRSVHINSELFGKTLLGKIDYYKINPTSHDYAGSFNINSDLRIFNENHKKIGDIVLAPEEQANKLDFAIRFSNGSSGMLKEYLLPLRELLNFKY